MHIINCVYATSINEYLSNLFRWIKACDKYSHFLVHELLIEHVQSHEYPILSNYQRHNYTHLPRINHVTITTTYIPYYTSRTVLTCLQQPPYSNNLMSAILPETQIYLPAYSNLLTITTTCLPYYQKHNCTYLPTATTLQ